MEREDNTFHQQEEIEVGNDDYIVSLENEEDLKQKGYRLSVVDFEGEKKEDEFNNDENNASNVLASSQSNDDKTTKNPLASIDNRISIKSKNDNKLESKTSLNLKRENNIPRMSELNKEEIMAKYNTNSYREPTSKKADIDQMSIISNGAIILYAQQEIENLKEKVNQKISVLGNLHVFCLNNVNIILKIFKELTEILFRKINSTLDQNKKFLKYFKDIIDGYKKFCMELEKANLNIKNFTDENQLLSDNIINLIVTTQDTIKANFDDFSKKLNDSLIANGPFQKIKDIIARFELIKKNIFNDFKNLEIKKDKMVKKFNGKSVPIFTNFKKYENKLEVGESNNLKDLSRLFEENDFFLIEIEITLRINKLFNKIAIFLKNYKLSFEDLKKCVVEYAALVKDTVDKFLNENKKIYGGNMNLDFEHMQKFYESITKESLEKSFIVSRILGSDETINKFNEYFNEYRNDLIKFRIVKSDVISKQDKFNISNFQSLEDLLSFMIELIPIERKLASSLLIGKYDMKRDPGFFKSWKNCTILKTLQNNFLIYDDVINKRPAEIFNVRKLKFKKKEEKKFPYRFEISEKKKGMLFSSNVVQYFDAATEDNFNLFKQALDISN